MSSALQAALGQMGSPAGQSSAEALGAALAARFPALQFDARALMAAQRTMWQRFAFVARVVSHPSPPSLSRSLPHGIE